MNTINETLRRTKRRIDAQATTGRGICRDRIYTKRDFLASLGIGDESWRQMKAAGLKTATAGTKALVRGAEFERWVQEHEK